jgi:lipopolysaccharide/colanic/teichoic acid biosynthesis glycosyltransferase
VISGSEEYRYRQPDKTIRERYGKVFALTGPLEDRGLKVLFDKVLALVILVCLTPLLVIVTLIYFFDMLFFPDDRGPLFSGYYGASREEKFMKYKFRTVKNAFIDKELEKAGSVNAYPRGYMQNLTRTGWLMKKYYLDEIPQIWSVFMGDMSFVGPRALAWEHAKEEEARGNVTVKLLKAGLFSPTHVRKGTGDLHNISLDFGYVEQYMEWSSFALLLEDLRIIMRGIKVIIAGGGY